jgi:hypothetical protein
MLRGSQKRLAQHGPASAADHARGAALPTDGGGASGTSPTVDFEKSAPEPGRRGLGRWRPPGSHGGHLGPVEARQGSPVATAGTWSRWRPPGHGSRSSGRPLGVTYANTRRLPPHVTQANTSNTKVLRSGPAQSTRAVRPFLVSCLATAWGVSLASSAPSWGEPGRRDRQPR